MSFAEQLEGRFQRILDRGLRGSGPCGLLVALSGGLDSTALLLLCARTSARRGGRVAAGHVNHGVRLDADDEEARVRALCADLAIPFHSERIHLPPSPSEERMRRARLGALQRLARTSGCERILLGHQRDDLAETVLLNLTRGAGLRGMAGIPFSRGPFLHPLLGIWRRDLRRYLDEIGIGWVEDPSNQDLARARNRIRHRLLPWIEKEIRLGATDAIARAAEHLRRASDALESEARRCLHSCSLPAPEGEIRLDGYRLRSYDVGLTEIALRKAVRSISGTTSNIPAGAWRPIVDAAREARSGTFHVRGDVLIEVTGRAIRIARETPASPPNGALDVPWNGRISWGDGFLRSRLCRFENRGERVRLRGVSRIQLFDAARVSFPVHVRSPRRGDRIALEDAAGRGRLWDLLSEKGIPRRLRGRQPVIEDSSGILWAPGVRRAAVAKIGMETERIWVLRWHGELPVDHALQGGTSRG